MISHMRSYDAVSLLGFGAASIESLPDPNPGEIVLRYGGWSLEQLRESAVGKRLMYQQGWYDQYSWSAEGLPPGVYRLRIPVSDSNRKTFAEQQRLLLPGEEVVPAALAATALLCHCMETGHILLADVWIRSTATLSKHGRVGLGVYDGRVYVDYYWDGNRHEDVWLAGCRKLPGPWPSNP